MKHILLWLLSLLTVASPAAAQGNRLTCEQSAAAVVNSLRGAATLQRGEKTERLVEAKARGRRLRAGDKLQVSPGGRLVILFCGSREVKEISQKPPNWYTVPNVPSDAQDALFAEYFGRIPGRQRATSGAIFSPPDEGVAWPEGFTVRWSPSWTAAPLTLTLLAEMGEETLWEQTAIDGASGRFTSHELRSALRRVREEDPESRLKLLLSTKGGPSTSVAFRLLSAESGAGLARELREADQAEGFLRSLMRAAAFTQRQLYLDAAQEYEDALASSPESVELTLATIVAQCRAGDTARAGALLRQLPRENPARDKDCRTAFPDQ
ncbi:MAG TPA: tetratricopeptide repeat protein [Pyrinomonadaceae bacterium]|jgi:hypothetical protein